MDYRQEPPRQSSPARLEAVKLNSRSLAQLGGLQGSLTKEERSNLLCGYAYLSYAVHIGKAQEPVSIVRSGFVIQSLHDPAYNRGIGKPA